MDDNRDRVHEWYEEAADYFVRRGQSPITGRTMAWLMVCDPREQSPAQIGAAVRASRASLTHTLRFLTTTGAVRAVTKAGERTTYYRIADDAWAVGWRHQLEGLREFAEITREGVDALGPDSPQAQRMREAHDFYQFLLEEAEPLWERWKQRRREEGGQ